MENVVHKIDSITLGSRLANDTDFLLLYIWWQFFNFSILCPSRLISWWWLILMLLLLLSKLSSNGDCAQMIFVHQKEHWLKIGYFASMICWYGRLLLTMLCWHYFIHDFVLIWLISNHGFSWTILASGYFNYCIY